MILMTPAVAQSVFDPRLRSIWPPAWVRLFYNSGKKENIFRMLPWFSVCGRISQCDVIKHIYHVVNLSTQNVFCLTLVYRYIRITIFECCGPDVTLEIFVYQQFFTQLHNVRIFFDARLFVNLGVNKKLNIVRPHIFSTMTKPIMEFAYVIPRWICFILL